ncbi:hypothetical protein DL766_010300 [Monosporascus sp. MC13-8B]|uniref:Major facilitator superfamily (MFS) profile domain-containing protein n=1 Tax=Monosporascus cannonballus TaxID=155416 RepID=A0ABY0HGL1_9PEZI|nr:hypothetical protein DL762_001788 [Monosporascus cannonballus]RYO93792.1 hypothetical protein DL763_004277 [Monosporascus cannonballus]RYP02557.1 hypothetical protein DL766_010300 [Monosporascus sp. MC13-8B]
MSFEAVSQKSTLAPSDSSMRRLVKTDGLSHTSRPIHRLPLTEEFPFTETEKCEKFSRQATTGSQSCGSVMEVQVREDGTEYPTGLTLSLIVLAICLSILLMALDLPDVGWYGSAYLLASATLQLFYGKLYTFLSIKRVYLTAIAIFELGSLICGAAQNSLTLIMGRAVAGLGSAGILTGSLLILAHSVPLVKRPFYTGFTGSMYGVASVAGPLLGGVFTDKVNWRWCFFVNLPFGALTIGIVLLFFPDPARSSAKNEPLFERLRHFDPLGTIVFMSAIICILLALQWGGTRYQWYDARAVALLTVFGVLIIAFLLLQYFQQEDATVPPRIIKNRTVWASSSYSFCLGASFFVLCYYIPIWFQAVQGTSAVNSGIRNLPMLITVVVFSLLAGAIVTRQGYYAPFMITGTVLMAAGAGLLSLFTANTTTAAWVIYQLLFGAGVGLGMQQPLMAVQTVLDIRDVPTGTAVVVFLQTLGGALFVSVGQTVFANKLVQKLAVNVPGLNPTIVLNAGAANLQHSVSAEYIPGVILSYNDALTKTFLVAAGLAAATGFGSAAVEWRSVKEKKVEVHVA